MSSRRRSTSPRQSPASAGYKFGGDAAALGTVAFQVPIEFGGIPVTDQPFVQQAHGDGYGVHVWTIDDRAEK